MELESAHINIALIYQTTPMPLAMRTALAEQGVSIGYEASISTFDLTAFKAGGARAIVISMESEYDDPLGMVDQLLADGYLLIFNDADVSETLHGYDQARWARHLAAKLYGDPTMILPLRPLHAEAVALPICSPGSDSYEHSKYEEQISATKKPTLAVLEVPTLEELSPLQEQPLGVAHASNAYDAQHLHEYNLDIDPITRYDDGESGGAPLNLEAQNNASVLASGNTNTKFEAVEGIDADAASETLSTAMPLQIPSDGFQGRSNVIPDGKDTATRVADDWALLDFDAEISMPVTAEAPAVEPDITEAAPTPSSAPNWALAPLDVKDESLAGGAIKDVISRIWVLFGSIGAPEALREFLSYLPETLGALLIVVPPIGADFQAALMTQLTKASPLPIRVAEHGARATVGEVLLLPAQGRLQVKPDGRLLVSAEDGDGVSIVEWLMHDLVENFGIRAGIILLSGTVNGAIAACHQVADIGGLIWAQRSDSCVISSMVDSASDAGLVHYSAPPRQLAVRMAAICANLAE